MRPPLSSHAAALASARSVAPALLGRPASGPRSRTAAHRPVVTSGLCRKLTPHFDKPGYGCVIITVGLFGQVRSCPPQKGLAAAPTQACTLTHRTPLESQVLVQLTNRKASEVGHSKIIPAPREVLIGEGQAYGMDGPVRHAHS